MTSRKSRPTSKTGFTKNNYPEHLPKENPEESVEDMLANVDNFIDSVYRDLSMSPPRASTANNSLRAVETLEINSPVRAYSLSGTTSSNRTSLVSPVSIRNMDEEIERIHQICENVDQNLRSIGLFMNNSSSSNSAEPSSANLPTSEPTIISAFIEKVNSNNNTQRHIMSARHSIDTAVIDLSDSQTERPEISIQPLHLNNQNDGDDDDVILVSTDLPPIVDLCTPNHYVNVPRAVAHQIQLNSRRRLSQYVDRDDIFCEGLSPPRRHRPTPFFTKTGRKKTSYTEQTSTAGDANNPKFMCPVCMDSCLQNQPTSTICGHVFCKDCIERAIALTHRCPICKRRVSKRQTFRIYV